jgi:hypothetical protein
MSQLWRDNDLAMPEMQEVRKAIQMSKMRIRWSLATFMRALAHFEFVLGKACFQH